MVSTMVVIPADAGIHFALVFGVVAISDSRPCAFRRPSMVAGYFLLLAQKKVTKEKGTLAVAVCRHPCRQTSRAGSGVRSRHIPVPRSDARASCARPLRGCFLRLLAAAERGPGRAQRGSPCRRSTGYIRHVCFRFCFAFALGSPLSSGGGWTDQPREARAARWIAPIRTTGHGWPVGRTRPPVANPRLRRGRESEGAFFFGYFLLGKQKKVTGRHGWRPNHTRT